MASTQEPTAAEGPSAGPAPAPGAATASSSGSIHANTTVLATLHNILRAHVAAHPSPTLPYLHPYAPLPESSWKGKARAGLFSQAKQANALKAIRDTLEGAKAVLAKRENERLRLTRAMKEVVNHETALLPLGTTLSSLPPARRPPLSPKAPADLLQALTKRLGLQCFAEDSGDNKTSLTLAGERFVVDVDVEGSGSSDTTTITKLTATHITPGGETGKSAWVEQVLRKALDSYSSLWNTRQGKEGELRAAGRALECMLGELKMLDDLAVRDKSGIDYFAELETLATSIDEKTKGADPECRIYNDSQQGIFPSFRLLEDGTMNPAIRLRPTLQGESVSLPPTAEAQTTTEGTPSGGDAMDVDQQTTSSICKGSWVMEFIDENPEPCSSGKGLIVRRTWALPGPEDSESKAWSASMKVEGLLYQAAAEASGMAALPIFPYNADFVHAPADGLKQHWSMGHPGPEGFVVGRIALPGSWSAVGSVCSALRTQLVLDNLVVTAYSPSALKTAEGNRQPDDASANIQEDDAAADLAELEGARADIPISGMLFQQCMRVSLPLSEDADGALLLELQAAPAPPYASVSWRVDDGVTVDDSTRARLDAAAAGARNLNAVDIVRDMANALSGSG